MGKTRGVHETTPELRNRMVGMYEAGLGLREIAAAVNCSQRTVKRWLNRFDKEGTVETRERCGRKRATTVEQDEAIVRLATQTPITAAKAVLPALGLTCSVDTVRERLHKAGIHNWSPSRKYMQRIPLGDADGAAIQQAVWRPTGTQLGKKKSSKDSNRSDKNGPKKKVPPRKVRARDFYVGDGAPLENVKETNEDQGFVFHQQNSAVAQSHPSEMDTQQQQSQQQQQSLPTNQTEFVNALSLSQQQQPPYQHPGITIVQTWSLDLVQGTHPYATDPSTTIPQDPSSSQQQQHQEQQQQQQLQELHSQQVQQRMQEQDAQAHHHGLDQQRQSDLQIEHQAEEQQQQENLQSQLPSPQTNASVNSDNSNSCNSQESNQSAGQMNDEKGPRRANGGQSMERSRKKKKGGKAKGTLETSVEIRNRMIGMSEAGLSTLSIALAIDRSERTVKRWLERWHKEGNVQTKERKGRRRITTKEEDEAIVAMATQHPLTAAKYVAPALGLKCSVDTIRERLHKAGIHSWKLGKKQGEGNAVHTVHLWQPSGNRSNKPKILGEKKKKPVTNKKKDPGTSNVHKRTSKKMKAEEDQLKIVPPPANMIPEQPTTALPFHNSGTSPNLMQPVHNIPAPPPALVQVQPAPPSGPVPPPGPQPPMQPSMPPPPPPPPSIMQQRSDCRLAPTVVPPVSGQGNAGVVYPSCMVGTSSSHAGHMEQPDPLNYEPYIWSF